MSTHEIHDALASVSIGPPLKARSLTAFPILGGPADLPPILPLVEALRLGLVTITEISDAGVVPRVMLDNHGTRPVLLLDGEHLIGCKQNRVLNTSVLAPAATKLELPVSCVERGRWRADRSSFSASPTGMFAELRAAKVMQVSRSMRSLACAEADQADIWDRISHKAARMGSLSSTDAMDGIYRNRADEIERAIRLLEPVANQRGSIFAINGRVVGLELLPSAETWRQCASGVVSGYVLDSLDNDSDPHPDIGADEAAYFVSLVGKLEGDRFPGVGLGEEIRFDGAAFGVALSLHGAIVHLCAFARRDGLIRESGPRGVIRRPLRVPRQGGGSVY